jgi:hypothetical protein
MMKADYKILKSIVYQGHVRHVSYKSIILSSLFGE